MIWLLLAAAASLEPVASLTAAAEQACAAGPEEADETASLQLRAVGAPGGVAAGANQSVRRRAKEDHPAGTGGFFCLSCLFSEHCKEMRGLKCCLFGDCSFTKAQLTAVGCKFRGRKSHCEWTQIKSGCSIWKDGDELYVCCHKGNSMKKCSHL